MVRTTFGCTNSFWIAPARLGRIGKWVTRQRMIIRQAASNTQPVSRFVQTAVGEGYRRFQSEVGQDLPDSGTETSDRLRKPISNR
jgi:hypothetical protein